MLGIMRWMRVQKKKNNNVGGRKTIRDQVTHLQSFKISRGSRWFTPFHEVVSQFHLWARSLSIAIAYPSCPAGTLALLGPNH